ncbi:MAG: ribonuclease P protein component [Bacteroidales bacterium]|nr:ribonuclease P protein component [Bacteroidales bacterium]
METLPKSQRLSGRSAVSALMSKGRWGFSGSLKYCYLRNEPSTGANRIMVSVPKRFFKRAVKRNLLKRRMREAYRTQKTLLAPSSTDILFLYNSKNVSNFQTIKEEVALILKKISDEG